MPRGFSFIDPDVRAWTPAAFTAEEKSENSRFSQNHDFIGRLKPGATLAQAQAQIDAIDRANFDRLKQFQQLLTDVGFRVVAVPLGPDLVRNVRAMLYLLWGGALFVLLIGAVNVANLALVRSRVRLRELATRAALGAGRARLARQLITESLVVATAGGALGLLVGYAALKGFSLLNLQDLPRGSEIHMTGTVVAFVIGLAALVGVLIALVPVASVLRTDLSAVFHEDVRTGSAGRGARLLRRTLVITQVGLAFVLLFGAGLLLASFRQVLAVDPGFDPHQVLTASVRLPNTRYPSGPGLTQFADRALTGIRTLPGVVAAGATSNLPLGGDYSSSVILAEGYQMRPGESLISPYQFDVSPGYFESMHIPLLKGRFFTDHDTKDAPQVVIVDEHLARHFWPNTDPIGHRMYAPTDMQDLMAVTPRDGVPDGRRRRATRGYPGRRAGRRADRRVLLPDGPVAGPPHDLHRPDGRRSDRASSAACARRSRRSIRNSPSTTSKRWCSGPTRRWSRGGRRWCCRSASAPSRCSSRPSASTASSPIS